MIKTFPVVAVTALFVACAAPHPYGNLHRVSRDGCIAFAQARAAWVEARCTPWREPASGAPVTDAPTAAGGDGDPKAADASGTADPTTADARALAALTAALANDPGNPLFLQQRGDLAAWLGDDAMAEHDYRAALAICEDWVPGYLGMAKVLLRRRDAVGARAQVDDAILSLASIEHAGERGLPNPLRLLGLWVDLPEYRDPLDPTTDRQDGLVLLLQWLHEHLQWRVDNSALARGLPSAVGQQDSVLRMLRARTALLRLAVEVPDPTAAPARYLERLEHEVLALDPDCLDARFQKAMQLWLLRNLDAAEAVLASCWRDDNPMLQAHQGLAALTAQVFAERYAGQPAAARPARAVEFFRWLVRVHGGVRGGVYRLAQELVLGEADGDRERLLAAAAAADDATAEDAREDELLATVRAQLRRALGDERP